MTSFKKIHLAVILLLATSVGHAYDNYGNDSSCGSPMDCVPCQPVCCGRAFVNADLLYWRGFADGLDDCIPSEVSDVIASDGFVTSRFRGKGRNPHFNWDPGFRIRAEVEPDCVDWLVAATWTHFHSHASRSRNNFNKVRWNVDLDVIDLMLGYDLDSCSSFSWRPFVGLRGARIDQSFRRNAFENSSSFFGTRNRNKQDFHGAGPLIGLEANWDMGCNFSLYANASVAWLYGHFDSKLAERYRGINSRSYCSTTSHITSTLTSADAGLGIRWETCFCQNNRLLFQLGLEHHRYFDYNRIGSGCGDLSFDGINFSVGVEF